MSVSAAVAAPARKRHPSPVDVLRGVATWLAVHSTGARLVVETRQLEALSDAELARRGVRRDRIVNHVFGLYNGL